MASPAQGSGKTSDKDKKDGKDEKEKKKDDTKRKKKTDKSTMKPANAKKKSRKQASMENTSNMVSCEESKMCGTSKMGSTSKMSSTMKSTVSTVKSRMKESKLQSKMQTTTREPTFEGATDEEGPQSALTDELFRLIGKSLTNNTWYHGIMPRQDCEVLLKDEGDFLVRKTTMGKAKAATYCISVYCKGEVKHYPVHFKDLKWSTKNLGSSKDTLAEFVEFLVETRLPIPPAGAVLKTAVARPDYYILHENVTLNKKLGAGAFGEVYTGVLKRKKEVGNGTNGETARSPVDAVTPVTPTTQMPAQEEEVDVAVKKIKGKVSKNQMVEFVKEAKLMRRFNHPNIVRFYGVAPQEEPIMIILELAKGGGLKDYCKKCNYEVKSEQLHSWAKDAARGMCYLTSRLVIHRDLAARNCLLGENLEIKISDFGLSVADRSEIKLHKLKSMPIKWLAPETLKLGLFSKKSDVWAYGILLWEIYSYCKTDPFPGENNVQARKKILSGKDPLDPPPAMTAPMDAVLKQCFTQEPDARPEFDAILKLLSPEEKLQAFETYATH